MPNIKTNLLRINIRQPPHLYEVGLVCKCDIESQHQLEIDLHINNILPHSLYRHPYLYSP